jgi:hypothetical protein
MGYALTYAYAHVSSHGSVWPNAVTWVGLLAALIQAAAAVVIGVLTCRVVNN